MQTDNFVHVKIGEVKTGKPGEVLKATLGSCVGIAFVWRKKDLYALAHCLLPEDETAVTTIGAKFVNQAVLSLVAILKIKPEDVVEIEVSIAGGGNMMAQLLRKNTDHVGLLNVAAAKKYLGEKGFHVRVLDVAGDEGRQIYLDCSTGEVTVQRLNAIA